MISSFVSGKDKAIKRMNDFGRRRLPFLFIIDYKFVSPLIIPLSEIDPGEILYQLNEITNQPESLTVKKKLQFTAFPETYVSYSRKFSSIIRHLQLGNSYLANLTCCTPVASNFSLQEIYSVSKAKFKLLMRDHFVVFSPEIFVEIRDGIISSFPMKGTIDARLPNAEKTILDDRKEKAEHYTIVDLIRNDLSQVAKQVRVENFRYIDRIETSAGPILQVSSKITGKLPDDFESTIGTLFSKLLPAGSVTGAPKAKTVAILSETEGYDRGYYTGVFGLFDGRNIISAVMIRFLEKTPVGYFYKSGGGITASSDPEKEYREMIKKIYVPVV